MKLRIALVLFSFLIFSQNKMYELIYDIISNVSQERLKSDVQKLVDFGTRHTLSDTISKTRGIGAARRWIKNSFDLISEDCNNCLDVFFQKNYFEKNNLRLIKNVWINNVVAIQKLSLIHI